MKLSCAAQLQDAVAESVISKRLCVAFAKEWACRRDWSAYNKRHSDCSTSPLKNQGICISTRVLFNKSMTQSLTVHLHFFKTFYSS